MFFFLPSVKLLLRHLVVAGRKMQNELISWGSTMKPLTFAEFVKTAGWLMIVGGQHEQDMVRQSKARAGGPMLLWLVPGNKNNQNNLLDFPPNKNQQIRNSLKIRQSDVRLLYFYCINNESPSFMRGDGQTGHRETELRPVGQTFTEKSILHHPFSPSSPHSSVPPSLWCGSSIIYSLMCYSSFSGLALWLSATTHLSAANNRPFLAVVELWCWTD